MRTFAWDMPGYVQGQRFSNNPSYWNASTGRFRDLAGYSHLGNDVQSVAGTPIFEARGANNRIGLRLDNSNTYKLHPANPWEGSYLFVVQPTLVSLGYGAYPWLWGNSESEISNGNIHIGMNRVGTERTGSLMLETPSRLIMSSLALSWPVVQATGAIGIFVWSLNQTDHTCRATKDGLTIELIENQSAGKVAIGGASAPGDIPDIGGISHDYLRFGDMTGDGSLVVDPDGDCMHAFEHHFWKGDIIKDNLDQLIAFIANLSEYYGI